MTDENKIEEKVHYRDQVLFLNLTHKEMLAFILGLTESELPFPKDKVNHALKTHFAKSWVPPNRRNRSQF